MTKKDLTDFFRPEVTATRTKKPMRPETSKRITAEYNKLPPNARERAFELTNEYTTKRAEKMWKQGQVGVSHRATAADAIRAVRKIARPQGQVPTLLRESGRGSRKLIATWQDLPAKYRSRVGFEVHEAKLAGVPETELPKIARRAAERLAMRQAAKELGNPVKKLPMVGPIGIVSEILGYIADRKQGVKHPDPMNYDEMPLRPRQLPRFRSPRI